MGDLRLNFSRSEFKCPHCGRLEGPSDRLLDALQALRTAKGRALTIISGYRCPTKNAAVGGASNSRHMAGDAADIPGGYATVDDCQRAGFVSVGVRHGRVIHVDTWPGRAFHVFQDG